MRMFHNKLTPYLCRQHLLGAHSELHKFRHNFVKRHSINGRIYPVIQIEPSRMESYHNELVDEMERRGYNHNSPYEQPDLSYLPDEQRYAEVSFMENYNTLIERCPDCADNLRQMRI